MFDALVLGFLIGLLAVALLLGQIRKLRQTLKELGGRVAGLEARMREPATPPSVAQKAPVAASPLLVRDPDLHIPEEPKLVSPITPLPIVTAQKSVPAVPPPLPITPPPPIPAPSTFNWEAFMGVKLFAWLGGLALFLGVVFLVKYSFENNLITPLGRLTIGGIVGAGLVAIGWWLARGQYRVYRAESLRDRHCHPLRRSIRSAFLLPAHIPGDGVFRHGGNNSFLVPARGGARRAGHRYSGIVRRLSHAVSPRQWDR